MQFNIRSYHPSDLTSLYQICLLTGDSGKDASKLYKDPDLLGQYYAAPYAVLEPDLCFIIIHSGVPCGYILGTRDSALFSDNCEKNWFPVLRERYPIPEPNDTSFDARIIRLIHEGYVSKNDLIKYPAHLHINLLPLAQGHGMGRKLINTFLDKIGTIKVPAVHLEVGKSNTGAIEFYKRVGFHIVKEFEKSIAFGILLI
ncbi:GNAT family N-acetyltransferase [Bacteroidota bacterium]